MSHKREETTERRVADLLSEWLTARLDGDRLDWVEQKRRQLGEGAPDRVLFTSFSAVPRYTGKADLALTQAERQAAAQARTGWQPGTWSLDQAARTLLLLSLPAADGVAYAARLEPLFSAADVGEAVALYQSLPVLPQPEHFRTRAVEGLRTNMKSVFEAVALRNPYPAEFFDKAQWNQMVLKAVFVGSTLDDIYGFDERANPDLARMLVDYAHERWAASRDVTPELWRGVGPYADAAGLETLQQVLSEGTPPEREAAQQALAQTPAGWDVLEKASRPL